MTNARWIGAGSAAVALLLGGCTGGGPPTAVDPPVAAAGELRLAAFDSCDQALGDLRRALLPLVGPYGLNAGGGMAEAGAVVPAMPGPAMPAEAAAPAERDAGQAQDKAAAPEHSSTNTHE